MLPRMLDKNSPQFLFLLMAIFLISSGSVSKLYSQPATFEWQQLKSDFFIIHYQANDHYHANTVLKTVENFYPRLASEIGYQLNTPVQIFLANTEKTYRSIVGRNFPKWSEGLAVPSSQIIVIKTTNDSSDPRKTVIHELTHILLNGAVNGKPIPRWFNEGLAIFYSDEKEFASSSLVSKALITNSIIPLADIDEVLTFHTSKAQLAYQESYLAVIFLIEKFGIEGIKKIVQALASAENPDQAFLKTIGMDLLDFDLAWYKHIKQKFRWHFLIEFETYLWLLILMLFILGFILMRRRNKKIIESWNDDEEEASI